MQMFLSGVAGPRDAKLRWILSAALLGALVRAPCTALASAQESVGPEAPPRVSRDAKFSDDDGAPYERAIEVLAADDIVSGCDEDGDRYCPHDPVRRDQAASLLARAFDLPDASHDHFDDGNEHERDINRLASAGDQPRLRRRHRLLHGSDAEEDRR